MLTKLKQTNIRLPDGYEMFVGGPAKLTVSHVRCGSILFFNKLSELRKWIRQVNDVRAMANNELTFLEKLEPLKNDNLSLYNRLVKSYNH